MTSLIEDTIVALATPAAPGGRTIVRLSGSKSLAILKVVFSSSDPQPHRIVSGTITLSDVPAPLAAELYFWPAPHSYTGQDVAELHTIGCPPLVERLVAALLGAGARAAGPGEFTQRAFLAGKLDLTRAEAVHAVIEAGGRTELKQALAQLAGGMARPLAALRENLLDLLADIEAALDFADEEITFVEAEELLLRLGSALAQVTLIGKQLDSRTLAGQVFRVALTGRPNAGKSSLFNALAGAKALVSDVPGTTRDYLTARLDLDGVKIELLDTPGTQTASDSIDTQAQALGRQQVHEADLLLVCIEAGTSADADETALFAKDLALAITTKCDLRSASFGLPTSAVTGAGLGELRSLIAQRARDRDEPPLAPSIGRCRHHVAACLDHLRRAHAIVLEDDPPEILALELREALHQLGEMAGAVYTDDLLDRIFSRFCIGK